MSEENVLKEIQSLFPRQKHVNAIDVFINQNINREETNNKTLVSNKKLVLGDRVKKDVFVIKTPDGSNYSKRYFDGSDLSLQIAEDFNDKYGILALSIQLYKMCRNYIGKEIVRAFIKNYIRQTAIYFRRAIKDDKISKDNLKYLGKKQFLILAFDPGCIKKQMRDKAKNNIALKFPKANITEDKQTSDKAKEKLEFIKICKENGLDALQPVVEIYYEMLLNDEITSKEFKGLGHYIKIIARTYDKKFYKSLNQLFNYYK